MALGARRTSPVRAKRAPFWGAAPAQTAGPRLDNFAPTDPIVLPAVDPEQRFGYREVDPADLSVREPIGALGVSPRSFTMDVSPWAGDLILVQGAIGAAGTTTITAQWSDAAGLALYSTTRTLALAPSGGAFMAFTVAHLGPTVTYTFSGYTGAPTITILHLRELPRAGLAPCTPNMVGTVVLSTIQVMAAASSANVTARGTGGAEIPTLGYVGPALMTVRALSGTNCWAQLRDANGNVCGSASAIGAGSQPNTITVPVMVPPTQYAIYIENAAAQTVAVHLVAN